MKKFVGDTLVFLSVVLGIATVYWLWSWNWFFAIIIGLFVFVFLCNIGAELSPPEPQGKVSVNDKLEVVANNENTELQATINAIQNIVGKISNNYDTLDKLNEELTNLHNLNPCSNKMRIKVAKEIIIKAEQILLLLNIMATDFEKVCTMFNNNRDDIAKINPRLVDTFDAFVTSNKEVFSTTNRMRVQDIIYYYKEFLN